MLIFKQKADKSMLHSLWIKEFLIKKNSPISIINVKLDNIIWHIDMFIL